MRGYLETDYDYPAAIGAVKQDLEAAVAELMDGVEGDAREQLKGALGPSFTPLERSGDVFSWDPI